MGIELVKALFNTVMVTAGVTIIWWIVGAFISDALSDNPKYDDVISWLGYIALIARP